MSYVHQFGNLQFVLQVVLSDCRDATTSEYYCSLMLHFYAICILLKVLDSAIETKLKCSCQEN